MMFTIPETFADDMVKHQMVNPGHEIIFKSRVIPAVLKEWEKPTVEISAECLRTGCGWVRRVDIKPKEWNSG